MRSLHRAAAGIVPAAALLLSGACDERWRAVDVHAGVSGYVVDSILPPEEMLRRFQAGTESVSALAGAPSRDELMRRFQRALLARNGSALRALAVTRAEFAWLVYPESRISRPPFRQPPDVAWTLLASASDGGLRKLLQRAPTMVVLGHTCRDSALVEGRMRTSSNCTVRVRTSDSVRDMRLFGRLVELDGRWKIVGFDGDL